MSEPTTEAGKRLVADAMSDDPMFPADFGGAVVAIEEEASRAAAVDCTVHLAQAVVPLRTALAELVEAASAPSAMQAHEWARLTAALAKARRVLR